MKFYFIVLSLMLGTTLPAQSEMITLRARFLHNTQPIRQAPVSGRIGSSSFVSDSNGEIRINLSINPGQRDALISLNNPEWKISYPLDGRVVFPRQENAVVEIHLADGSDTEYDRQKQLIAELQQIKKQIGDQSDITQILDAFDEQLTTMDQRFLQAIDQQLRIRDEIKAENERREDLLTTERAASLQKGRLETRNLLNSVMDHYISRSLDLKDILQFKGNKVFQRDWIVAEIAEVINAYSEAYEELNRNRNKLQNMVSSYWPDDYPKLNQTEQLLQYALDDLHKTTALTATPLLNEVNDFNQGKGNKKRRKKELISDIEKLVYELSIKINTLTDRKSKVFQLLEQH